MSPHTVQVLLDTITSGAGMGVKHGWTATGTILPCLIELISSKDEEMLSQAATRIVYEILWRDDPALDPVKHRLRIVTPATHAGKILRLSGPPTDAELRGWMTSADCEYHSEDQETGP